MRKGVYLSKGAAVALAFLGIAATAAIISLSVVYSQERSKGKARPSPTERSTTPSPPAAQEPWHDHRLPTSLLPVFYNLVLWPRLEPRADGLFFYTGNSSVVLDCVNNTDLILLHSNMLNLTSFDGHLARLRGLGGATAPGLSKTWLEEPTQYLVVQLSGELQAGSTYELYTEFAGELADDLRGFYRSEYEEGGENKVLATSHMQPTDARKAFPCFDEPAMKAVFQITLIHPPETVALSNAMNHEPVNVTVDGQPWVRTGFEPTKKMSTYLLAFVVCQFGYRESQQGADLLIRIWAREQALEAGKGAYALAKTGPILAYFERYYNSPYPLEKSDQVAVPDILSGGMENWGLITYSENALLCNPSLASNGEREWVATVISHELAHMWFGNLVTVRWWNDLWLNEGFATYVSYLGAHYAEPTWDMKDLIVLNEVIGVMAEDAKASSRPLSTKEEEVQTPEQIWDLFDAITYSKGAAVLRMLSDFITEEVFSKGLHTYLEEFKYKNTVHADLWKHLQMAVEKAGLTLPQSVEAIMNRWILQMGFPVVTIDTRTGTLVQGHFLLDPDTEVKRPSEYNYEWFVPVTWMKNDVVANHYWLLDKNDTNPAMAVGPDEWLLANINMSGFYRVNYDAQNWRRLLAKLDRQHQDIPLINRAQIMDDAFSLARARMLNLTLALSTTNFLHREVEFLPWQVALKHLDYLHIMLCRTDVFGPMQAYMKKLVTPLFKYFQEVTATHIARKVKENFRTFVEKSERLKEYYLVSAFRKNPSLGELLIRARVSPPGNPPLTRSNIPLQHIPWLLNRHSGKVFRPLCRGHKHSKNCIYVILCQRCHAMYVGETGNTIATRFHQHKYNIIRQKNTTTYLTNARWSVAQRKRAERLWITKLGTKHPGGLNEAYDSTSLSAANQPQSTANHRTSNIALTAH
ncbi:aminopeptidase Ey-like [Nerophis ophidion]|uniref:aminopeptidase Ey-like n=1 Tax=Nerophis ophidion TaxID=159077 RepID=UPI002ADFE1C8|nr:aminopeptidase Ey-like [Nerophis ophidion]